MRYDEIIAARVSNVTANSFDANCVSTQSNNIERLVLVAGGNPLSFENAENIIKEFDIHNNDRIQIGLAEINGKVVFDLLYNFNIEHSIAENIVTVEDVINALSKIPKNTKICLNSGKPIDRIVNNSKDNMIHFY